MTTGWITISNLKSLLFTYDSRLNRQPFIIIMIIVVLLESLISLAGVVLLGKLFSITLTACPTMKRFHDRGYSGWWWAYSNVGLIVSLLMATMPLNLIHERFLAEGDAAYERFSTTTLLALSLLGSAACIGLILWLIAQLYCLRGTEGPNEYGPDPLDKSSSSSLSSS